MPPARRAPGERPYGRFDDREGEFRTLYASGEPAGAFAETFLRDRGPVRLLSVRAVLDRRCAVLGIVRPLKLVQLHEPGLARLGADAGVSSGPYRVSRAWARALWAHPAEVDGIVYGARHDDAMLSAAVFDRARARIEVLERARLLGP